MNEQKFTLDVSKEPAVLPVLYLGQGDKNGTTLVAELYDNGVALSASGYVPSFEMRLPGGKAYYKADGTLSGNVATIPIDETYAAAVAGRAHTAYVSLKSGGNVVSTTRMNVVVLESATNDVNPGQAYENGIEQAIADAESRIASAASSAASQVAQAQEQATAAIAQAQADQQQAADDLNAAMDALGDISEVAVPLMSEAVRGGAKLGSGLVVDDGKLSLGDVVTDSHDGPIYSVDAEGWSEQETTTGKNLLDPSQGVLTDGSSITSSGITFARDNNTITVNGTATSEYPQSILVKFDDSFNLEAGRTYTISKSVANIPSGGRLYAMVYENDVQSGAGQITLATLIAVDSVTFTPTKPYTHVIVVAQGNGVTWSRATIAVQLEAGSTATEYEPYTGGKPSPSPDYPQEIRVARGRNLLDKTAMQDGWVLSNGEIGSYGNAKYAAFNVEGNETYTFSATTALSTSSYILLAAYSGAPSTSTLLNRQVKTTGNSLTLTTPTGTTILVAAVYDYALIGDVQLELGSTPTPYVPYGHVGLEVRNATTQELVDVRAIPLPLKSDGERWAGGLPDGTADVLTLDSAGKWEWESASARKTIDAASYDASNNFAFATLPGIKSFNMTETPQKTMCNRFTYGDASVGDSYRISGGNVIFQKGTAFTPTDAASATSWFTTNETIVYYPLATPTTEHGYIDLPYVSEGSTITIPELEDVGIKCFVDGARELAEHANNWGERCKENESRIAALEAAIAEIATA